MRGILLPGFMEEAARLAEEIIEMTVLPESQNHRTVEQWKFQIFLAHGNEWTGHRMTEGRFARRVMGVHQSTVCKWKRLPGFMTEVTQLVDEIEKEFYPKAHSAHRRRVLTGDPRAYEAFLIAIYC